MEFVVNYWIEAKTYLIIIVIYGICIKKMRAIKKLN